MEDLSRFSGPVGGSSRLAAYRARLNGKSDAQTGLAAALARCTSGERNATPLAARTMPTSAIATAKVDAKAERSAGRAAENKRWATVLAHEASKGRERLAAHLLSQPQRFAASDIIAALCSSDMGNATAPASTKQVASTPDWGKAASWDDVHAEILIRTGRA